MRRAVAFTGLALLLSGNAGPAQADDQIDEMIRNGRIPKSLLHEHGYSDFPDPLGRFMDLLAAGAVNDARAIQPTACAQWRASRKDTALSGKFWALGTEIDLNTLCAPH